MSTAIGTTPLCQHCGRPILGAVFYGNAGEPYHYECTQSPYANSMFQQYSEFVKKQQPPDPELDNIIFDNIETLYEA